MKCPSDRENPYLKEKSVQGLLEKKEVSRHGNQAKIGLLPSEIDSIGFTDVLLSISLSRTSPHHLHLVKGVFSYQFEEKALLALPATSSIPFFPAYFPIFS